MLQTTGDTVSPVHVDNTKCVPLRLMPKAYMFCVCNTQHSTYSCAHMPRYTHTHTHVQDRAWVALVSGGSDSWTMKDDQRNEPEPRL